MVLGKYESPLGGMLMAVEDSSLAGLWFDDQKYFGAGIKPDAAFGSHPVFEKISKWLDIFFSGKQPDFMPPLAPSKNKSTALVREAMLSVPYGATISYSELALKAGMPSAVRAVAGIVARNPYIIIVPCHRIIGKGGQLTGYAAGLDRKRKLLELERQSS